jgi:glycosyltransferase involved in cell wall biosynthesis
VPPPTERRRRVAYLSYSSAEFDARTQRMARSAVAAGYEVVVYARWDEGLPLREEADGYRIVRVLSNWQLAIPGLRRRGWRAVEARRRRIEAEAAGSERGAQPAGAPSAASARSARGAGGILRRARRVLSRRPAIRKPKALLLFPLRPLGWAEALEPVAQPADLWHGMWAGSLPALGRLRRRHGGRTIYDSRDVFMHARAFDRMHPIRRWFFQALERRWAHQADAVITVNDAYAGILERTLRIPRPPVVMNCPERWLPPTPRPDRVREALSLPPETRVVLYQGNLMSDRGIEQSMDAILQVPDAVLALLGYGQLRPQLEDVIARAPYRDRVFLLPPVPPSELLTWTASADVLVMAIQPSSLNHQYTTPQKLFEAIAAEVPVVAADLPGIAAVVRSTGTGVLIDSTSPPAIAIGIRDVLTATPEERAAYRARARAAADERYNWEAQLAALFGVYDRLLGPSVG